MKRSNHIFPNNTICWVYIYTDGKKAEGSFRIAYHLDLREEMKRLSGDAKLISFRRFHNIADALGHKLLLEHLSRDSLDELILRMNPNGADLRREILPKEERE